MGLPKFLNIKKGKKNNDSDSSSNVPLPPQKPSKGESNTPLSQSIPPPPKPGGDPTIPDMPPEPISPDPVLGEPTSFVDDPASSEPSPEAAFPEPAMPAAPGTQEQSFESNMPDMPSPDGSVMPEESKFDLPSFDEPTDEPTSAAQADLDWTQDDQEVSDDTVSLDTPKTPTEQQEIVPEETEAPVQEFSFAEPEQPAETTIEPAPEVDELTEAPVETPVEETPAEPETVSWHEDVDPAPTKPIEKPTVDDFTAAPPARPENERIHTEDGELFVKAEHFKDLFDAIKDIRTDVNQLETSLHSFASTSKEQEGHYEQVSVEMNEVQQNLLSIDTKIFERA